MGWSCGGSHWALPLCQKEGNMAPQGQQTVMSRTTASLVSQVPGFRVLMILPSDIIQLCDNVLLTHLFLTPLGNLSYTLGLLKPGRQELLRCVMVGNWSSLGRDFPCPVISPQNWAQPSGLQIRVTVGDHSSTGRNLEL